MDDLVLRGMARWPDVPAVYGWLALNRRGEWLLKGDPIRNSGITAYISRNYEADEHGRWFFQNGPQRVFVALDYTPFVFRTAANGTPALALQAHTGRPAHSVRGAWLDEDGTLVVDTDVGPGLVDDRDLEQISNAFVGAGGMRLDEDALTEAMEKLQSGEDVPLYLQHGAASVKVAPLASGEVPQRFGFERCPVAPEGHPECP